MGGLDLKTLIPAVVLPMTADFGIDEPELRRYLGWVKEQGIRVVAVNADTGQGPQLSRAGRPRVIVISVDVFAESGDGITGPFSGSTHQAVTPAREAPPA